MKSTSLQDETLPLPTTVTVETTASCQLSCPACPTPVGTGRARGVFSEALFQKLVSQIDWQLEAVSFGWSGEPLLNRQLPKLIAAAGTTGALTYVSTNGLLLERDAEALLDSGLAILRICVDGTSQEMAERYRVGIDFDQVLRGTGKIVNLRQARGAGKPKISLQMLITRDTQDHMQDFFAIAKSCGVDEVYFKSFSLSLSDWLSREQRREMAMAFLPSNPRFLRYECNSSGDYVLRSDLRQTQCQEVVSSVTILHTGDVVPCCEDFGGVHVLGNIHHETLAEIWTGERYKQLRREVRNREPAMCRECSYPGSDKYNQTVQISREL